jgi:hypothetical protein
MTWNEPYFFVIRTLGLRHMIVRFAASFALGAVVLAGLLLIVRAGPRAGQQPRLSAGLVTVGVVVCTLFAFERTVLARMRRSVSLSSDGITVVNRTGLLYLLALGPHLLPGITHWNRAEIERIELQQAGESQRPCGVLRVHLRHALPQEIGFPGDLTALQIAEVLHGYGFPVSLSCWNRSSAGPAASARDGH